MGYPVQADLFLICYYCILLYVGSLSNKINQSINQSIRERHVTSGQWMDKSFNRMATKDGKEKKRKAEEKMER